MLLLLARVDKGGNMSDTPARPEPEQMRETVREYVLALHTTYVEHVKHLPPAQRGALPLISTDHLSVIAAAAHSLHLIATDARLPAPTGPEVALGDRSEERRVGKACGAGGGG